MSLLSAVVVGLGAGVILALSPLAASALVLSAALLVAAGRGLPAHERRALTVLLGAALAVRLLTIAGFDVASMRANSLHTSGILFGDEAYAFDRALRTRDLLMQVPGTKYDYQIVYDSYGRTGYLSVLAWLQWSLGPSPFGSRAINGVIYVAGAAILYRLTRPAFGTVPALAGLGLVLFLPSLFFWSISLLKESVYFFLTAAALAASVFTLQRRPLGLRLAAAALVAVALFALAGLRPGAVALTGGAIACGAAASWLFATKGRLAAAAVSAIALVAVFTLLPRATDRITASLSETAKQHLGHAFTEGHAYKTLDARFYLAVETPAAMRIALTPGEAVRYVMRSVSAFVTMPLPWQVETRREMVFMPEQIVWYVMVLAAALGTWPAWRRDSRLTAILLAYVAIMALAIALTNGNVGTLVRLRGLVTPFLAWFSALGLAVLTQQLLAAGARSASAR